MNTTAYLTFDDFCSLQMLQNYTQQAPRLQAKVYLSSNEALTDKRYFRKRKNNIIIVVFLLMNSFLAKAQCDCYSINKIWIPENVKNEIHVSFTNICDQNVYLQFWLIQDKDTIARYDFCRCGSIPTREPDTIYEFETVLTKLPPINSLRVAISNGTLKCPSIKFSPALLVLSNQEEAAKQVKIYPNPTDDLINLENIPYNTNVLLYNLQGIFLQEWVWYQKQKISLKSYPNGTYLLKYQANNQTITHKIIKQ
jgi:hypothetical protein